jgi:uncharacterized damage-inducible protein DinB
MASRNDPLRQQLSNAIDWQEAHATFDQAVDGIPIDKRGKRAAGFEHSAWQLLEHLRLAQDDLLDFCRNPNYVHEMTWPDDYWPKSPEPPSDQAWADSVAAYRRTRQQAKQFVLEVEDLTARAPTGKASQTQLRSILLIIDHAAYHVGQIVALRRALGIWPTA